MLAIRSFPLVQALAKLEAVLGEVLLSSRLSFCVGHALFTALSDRFMHHDFVVSSFLQGLKVCSIP